MSLSTTSSHFLNTPRDKDSITSLGSMFQCLNTLFTFHEEIPPGIQSKPALVQFEAVSLSSITCCLRRGLHAPHCSLLSGSGRKRSSLSSASSSSDWTASAPSATPHRPCFLVPAPASLLFSEIVPAPQCPSCHERPKAAHRTRDVGSPELSTGDKHFPRPVGHTDQPH